jgi:UDP-N-acetylglucosamine:LPS N-acetylglucosamine transferase
MASKSINQTTLILGFFGFIVLLSAIAFLLWFIPNYSVYSSEQAGRATLARAEYSKKAQVQDAMAKLESAKYIAESAKLIESSLTPGYLQYLKIQMQEQVGERNPSAVYFFDATSSDRIVVPAK